MTNAVAVDKVRIGKRYEAGYLLPHHNKFLSFLFHYKVIK